MKLTKREQMIMDLMGQGNRIAYDRKTTFITKMPPYLGGEIEWTGIDLDVVESLINKRYIGPLPQHQCQQKLGWREEVGSIGEKFDIYACVQ